MSEQPVTGRPEATLIEDDGSSASTIPAPPFRPAAPAVDTGGLQLRGLPVAGQRVDDFELLQLLGTGAFARVFLARQVSLGRHVALKVSHNRGQEARTLASLEHDHIVRVFSEVIDAQHDLRLLCMQYVPGTTLEHVIQTLSARPREEWCGHAILQAVDDLATAPAALDLGALRDRELLGGLDFLEATCWVGGRLAEALSHAHGRGVLHRDIKPANILVNRYGRPLLVDFNVASSARAEPDGEQVFGGTLAYMAPEHLDAFNDDDLTPDSAVDARSDVYSLGVVLYELFTGRQPFSPPGQGKLSDVLHQMADERRRGAPLLSRHVAAPPALERVIARCLAPRPEDRYQSAAELAAALDSCRELCRVRRDLPRGGWLTRAALAHPFLAAAVLLPLPHVLGSVVNITYNKLRLNLTTEESDTFLWVMIGYNAVVYPVCLYLFFRQWPLVFRAWQRLSRPGPVEPAEVEAARRRALTLPFWGITVSCLGWLPGGVIFPVLIDWFAGSPDPLVLFAKFVFSFTISGLIALVYSVIAVEFLVVRVLYPGLWLDARNLRATATKELAREEGRLAVLQFLAVLIPLAGASLLLGVDPEKFNLPQSYLGFRLLVTGLMAAGMVGLGLAILAAREIRQAVDALTAARGRGRQ